jgi:DNA-binding transcriptional MerR regulator
MQKNRPGPAQTFSLDQLATLTDFPKRTIRYYIQMGLVPRPVGEGRAAHYIFDHLDRLIQIKRLARGGVSLERIRQIISGEPSPVPPRRRQPGQLDVKHHVYVAPGLEIVYSPEETDLSVSQLRDFAVAVMGLASSWGLDAAQEAEAQGAETQGAEAQGAENQGAEPGAPNGAAAPAGANRAHKAAGPKQIEKPAFGSRAERPAGDNEIEKPAFGNQAGQIAGANQIEKPAGGSEIEKPAKTGPKDSP